MKITVFGATGGTGQQLLRQAVEAGHEVTAVVRDPSGLPAEVANSVTVVRANAHDPTSIAPAIAGRDVVVTAIGSRSLKPTTVQADTTTAIIQAMAETGVRRLIMVSNSGMISDPDDSAFVRYVLKPVVGRVFANPWADMARTEEIVRASGLDWTIVRPPRLTDGPPRTDYRIAVERGVPGGNQISRASLADYLLRCMADQSTVHAAVAVGN